MLKSLLFVLLLSRPVLALADGYCLAIRGNGELAPAHWGAVASVVEKLGLPEIQAGGSSATITMMFLDAIASHPALHGLSKDQVSTRATFMIKSIEGVVDYLSESPEWRDLSALYAKGARAASTHAWLDDLIREISQDEFKSLERIARSFETGQRLGLITPKIYAPLYDSIVNGEWHRALFYAQELRTAISVFGSFDARRDAGLFFRLGVVDFAALGEQLGRLADFYSGVRGDAKAWADLLEQCAEFSDGKTWSELGQERRQCIRQLHSLLKSELANLSEKSFVNLQSGRGIVSIGTTAVLTGLAVEEARAARDAYHGSLNHSVGEGFSLSRPDDLRFGYWAPQAILSKIERDLPADDEKARRFLALGEATWGEMLALSPAEPGLSPLVEFKVKDKRLFSAGGWSDLHPVRVLKAAGCERVVYVTRRGGESFFAQGVAKRLLGLDRPWALLDSTTSQRLNNAGDASDMSSLWSRLFNLANPMSAFRQSLASADAVLCTDWNRFDIKGGITEMVRDGYRSPFYVRSRRSEFAQALWPQLNAADLHPNGYPTFAGCF